MPGSRIRDNPSFKKLRDEVQGFELIGRAFPFVRPVLKLIGVQVDQIDGALVELASLGHAARDLTELPDRFNDQFAARGWIMYEMMNVDAARAAVTKAEGGDVDGAEQDLVAYYDEEAVNRHITWMTAVKAFRPRIPRARQALADYAAGRFHACVPVVLGLLDGMVNDLGPKGFFAEGVNLEAWDSVAAHSTGLAALRKLLGQARIQTTTGPITLPYRHGILHGMDLGYDNQLVAAKAWAALFAAREWAIKVEHGEDKPAPPQPKPSWREIFRQLRDAADDRRRLDTWKPRAIRIGVDIPASGFPEAFQDGTPERRLVEFLTSWRQRNYGFMARCGAYIPSNRVNATAGELRRHYAERPLIAFQLVDVRDEAAAVTIITAKLICGSELTEERQIDFRMLCLDNADRPVVRGKPGGRWVLTSVYV